MASASCKVEYAKVSVTHSEKPETPVPQTTTNTKRKTPRRNRTHDDFNKKLSQFSFRNDLMYLMKLLSMTDATKRTRLRACTEIRELVTSVQEPGEHFEVVDVSLGQLGGFNLDNIPLELAIIDCNRPNGLPPQHSDGPMPLLYDSLSFSRILAKHGYSGNLEDFNPLRESESALYFHRISWEAGGAVADYVPLAHSHAVLQPTITVPSKGENAPTMHIYMAHPSHVHRIQFIRDHFKNVNGLRLFATALWLVFQSWGVRTISPSTCTLFGIQQLHENHNYSKPTIVDGQALSPCIIENIRYPRAEFWNQFTSEQNLLIQAPSEIRKEKDLRVGTMLQHTFGRLSEDVKFRTDNVFSIQKATITRRAAQRSVTPPHMSRRSKSKSSDKPAVRAPAKNEETDSSGELQPFFWAYHTLIISDPFVPLQNITWNVTNEILKTLTINSKTAAQALRKNLPLFTIIRPDYVKGIRKQVDSNTPSFRTSDYFMPRMTSTEILTHRSRIVLRVNQIVAQTFGKSYSVECFGSTRYGVDSATSDLDLVVIDHNRLDGFPPSVVIGDLPKIYDLKFLANALQSGGFGGVRGVPFATVPIVKFKDPQTGISCDININDQLGLFNTRLITRYCELAPVLRPLLVALKQWAKPLGLNNPSGTGVTTSFSSYALTLMSIAFLQSRQLLPNLQGDLDQLPPSSASGTPIDGTFWLRSKKGERQRCDHRFNRLDEWVPRKSDYAVDEVGRALYDWFMFFGHHHNYAKELLCIQYGGLLPRSMDRNVPSKRKSKPKKVRKDREELEATASATISAIPSGSNAAVEQGLDNAHDTTVGTSTESSETFGGQETPDAVLVTDKEDLGAANVKIGTATAQDAELECNFDDVDLPTGKHPKVWLNHKLVVVDPFIPTKNCAGSINKETVERFIQECRRAVLLMDMSCPFEQLLTTKSYGNNDHPRGTGDRRSRGGRPRSVRT